MLLPVYGLHLSKPPAPGLPRSTLLRSGPTAPPEISNDLMEWQAVHPISEKYCLPFWGSYLIPVLGAVPAEGVVGVVVGVGVASLVCA